MRFATIFISSLLFLVSAARAQSVFQIVERPKDMQVVQKLVGSQSHGEENLYRPVWSPDGKYLSAEIIDSKAPKLLFLDIGNQRPRKLTSHSPGNSGGGLGIPMQTKESANLGITWSQTDSAKWVFVYVGSGDRGHYDLYLDRASRPNGTYRKNLTNSIDHHVMFPNYHPAENLVVFCQGTKNFLRLKMIQTGGQSPSSRNLLPNRSFSTSNPRFSPTSTAETTHLAFVGGEDGANDLYILTLENLSSLKSSALKEHPPRQLIDWETVESHPRWSPDGRQIAFLSARGHEEEKGVATLYVINADGTGLKMLANSVVKTDNDTFAWHPDGQHIFFSKHALEEKNPICYVNVQSRRFTLLNTGTLLNSDLALSPDGEQLAFIAHGKSGSQNLTWKKLYLVKLKTQ